jgi:hypothetical protein
MRGSNGRRCVFGARARLVTLLSAVEVVVNERT